MYGLIRGGAESTMNTCTSIPEELHRLASTQTEMIFQDTRPTEIERRSILPM